MAVMGPTASGKTDLAENLASQLDADLINADAFQMYRGMDIGTAKPERKNQYHLIDNLDPHETYGVGRFVTEARAILRHSYSVGSSVVVVGGTGLYIRALFDEYTEMKGTPPDELRQSLRRLSLSELQNQLDGKSVPPNLDRQNPVRIIRFLEKLASPDVPIEPMTYTRRIKFGIQTSRDGRGERYRARILQMVQNGWIEEVERLESAGYSRSDPGFRAIGYAEMSLYLAGEMSLNDAIDTTTAATMKYAKRQETWLRSEKALNVLASDCDMPARAMEQIQAMY